jgi:hypothetical protein
LTIVTLAKCDSIGNPAATSGSEVNEALFLDICSGFRGLARHAKSAADVQRLVLTVLLIDMDTIRANFVQENPRLFLGLVRSLAESQFWRLWDGHEHSLTINLVMRQH